MNDSKTPLSRDQRHLLDRLARVCLNGVIVNAADRDAQALIGRRLATIIETDSMHGQHLIMITADGRAVLGERA